MSVGTEIRRRRREKGLTGAQLAARAGMSPSAVSQIETGKRTPSSTSVTKLAEALEVGVGVLYPKAEPPLFEDDQAAWQQVREVLDSLSDTELDQLHEEQLDQLDELRAEGEKDSLEYGRVIVGLSRTFHEKQTRKKSRTLA